MRTHAIKFTQPTMTQQHSKDETDINKIMARYIKTGVIDHVAKYQPQYLDNNDLDYHQSQNIIIKADAMFAELPSSVRRKFLNNPAEFLKFVSDEKNHEKLADLGLAYPATKVTPEKPSEIKKATKKPAAADTEATNTTTPKAE